MRLTSKFLVLAHKHTSACPCPLGRHTSQTGNNQNTNYRRCPGNARQKRGLKEVSQWPRQMAMGLLAQVPFLFVICSNFILKSFPYQHLLLKPDALLHHCLLSKWYRTSLLLPTELVKHSGIINKILSCIKKRGSRKEKGWLLNPGDSWRVRSRFGHICADIKWPKNRET